MVERSTLIGCVTSQTIGHLGRKWGRKVDPRGPEWTRKWTRVDPRGPARTRVDPGPLLILPMSVFCLVC